MSKSKSNLIFAMILVALLSLPIAHAQSFSGSKLYFILINAAIIGVVLFILQAFLVPNKAGKEQTSMWMIVIVVALLIAYLYGQNGFIWNVGPLSYVFNIYALVNTLVIAVILYFIGSFIPQLKLNSPEGKTGMGILLLIIAAVIAINFSPGRFIWSQDTVRGTVAYLFSGDAYAGDGARPGLAKGVLNPNGGLLIFISSYLILIFFFNNVLMKDQKGIVNYLLVLLFAFKFASPPANPIRHVIIIGEIVFGWVFYESLQKTFTNKWLAFFISFFLITFASTTLTMTTPESRGFLGSIGCMVTNCKEMAGHAGSGTSSGTVAGIVSTLKTIGWWALGIFAVLIALLVFGFSKASPAGKKWIGWGVGIGLLLLLFSGGLGFGIIGIILLILLIPALLIGLIVYGIGKGEKKWKYDQIFKRYKRILWNKIRVGFNNALNRLPFFKGLWIKEWMDIDRLPTVMKDNVVILYSLSNYLKRLYIYYVKMSQVEDAVTVSKQMMDIIGHHVDIHHVEEEIFKCRNGGIIKEAGQEVSVGYFQANEELANLMNKIVDFFREYRSHVVKYGPGAGSDPKAKAVLTNDAQVALGLADELSKLVQNKIKINLKYLDERAKAYGAHQVLKGWNYLVFDQCNPYGEYEHFYLFVEKGTNLLKYNPDNEAYEDDIAEDYLEVNSLGEVLIDKHKNVIKSFIRPWDESLIVTMPRKVKNFKDIKEFYVKPGQTPGMVHGFVLQDWHSFIADLRYGEFKPYSRSVFDYINALEEDKAATKGRLEFMKGITIPTTVRFKDAGNPAFDLRAIEDTGGAMTYLGRKNYAWGPLDLKKGNISSNLDSNGEFNPYPGVSSRGMSMYLPRIVKRRIDDFDKANEYLRIFLRDTGIEVGSHDAYRAFGSLGDEVPSGKGQENPAH